MGKKSYIRNNRKAKRIISEPSPVDPDIQHRRMTYPPERDELTFVGHSLGGGLAALSSKLTGRDAITFNPASLSGNVNVIASAVSLFRGGHITQYRAVGNGIFGGLFGDPVNTFQGFTGRKSQGKVIPVYVGKNCSHGIKDIIDAFYRNAKHR